MSVIRVALVLILAAATSAGAQTHERHTAAHDSAHAIMLSEADHMALHQFLLGRWEGAVSMHAGTHRDTLSLRFDNDSLHQMLMVRNRDGVSGFTIRGDSLQWKESVAGSACMASTSVAALLAETKSSAPPRIDGSIACGADRSAFILRKVGSR